jgi:hypothetical protein
MKEDIIKPKRYTGNKLECWDFWLLAGLNPLVASAVKYVWRYKEKNGVEDLKKALVFLDKMKNTPKEMLYFTKTEFFASDELLENMSDIQRFIVNTSVQTTHENLYKVAISDMEIAINYLIKTEYGELSD